MWWLKQLEYAAVMALVLTMGLAIVLSIVACFQQRARKIALRDWHDANGSLEDVNAVGYEDVHVSYSYVLNGERYGGIASESFEDEKHAAEFLAGAQTGTELLIKVNPEHPEKSVFVKIG